MILFLSKIKWKYLILVISILGVAFLGYSYFQKLKEIERLKNNNRTLSSTLLVEKTKSGTEFYKAHSLVLSNKELQKHNAKLVEELKDMKIKFKNTQNVSKLNYTYSDNISKITTQKIPEEISDIKQEINNNITIIDSLNNNSISKYNFTYNNNLKNNSYVLSGVVNVPVLTNKNSEHKLLNQSEMPYITDVNISLTDSLLVVPTINYKRFLLFFKRPVSVTVNIKSSSNIFKLNSVETYMIKQ